MKKRVLFYCQSLLGIGHFIRSRELLFALHDFEVCFLYGGESVPGFTWPDWVEVVYLPALRSDAAFAKLYVVDGAASLAEIKARRGEMLLAAFDRFAPDILLIELFPFGRKKFNFELLPLLARARAAAHECRIVCSLRDILVSRAEQAGYETGVAAVINQYFDLLLVHADPRVQRLEESFGGMDLLQCPIRYTGYVAQPAPAPTEQNAADDPLILVSIGGGRVGHELITCALEASPLLPMAHRIQIFTGPHIPPDVFAALQDKAASLPHVNLQRHTTEFPLWLSRAALSISQAGYNTCMDILAARARALVYPFSENGNDEQTRRAHKLEQLGCVRMLDPAALTPSCLAAQIGQALSAPPAATAITPDLQGAARTASMLAELLAASEH
ncbi:MAG: glycosyltransferase family protein [Blastocatellia bacterium]